MGSQDVLPLNLIALPAKGLSIRESPHPKWRRAAILDEPFSNIQRFSPLRMTKSAAPPPLSPLNLQNPIPSFIPSRDSTPHGLPLKTTQKNAM